MPKRFKDVLKMPPKGELTPQAQVSHSTPGTKYSAVEVVKSPTAEDLRKMKAQEEASELQEGFMKRMKKAGTRRKRRKTKKSRKPS